MFSGIVEAICPVVRFEPLGLNAADAAAPWRLAVRLGELAAELRPGQSVAINGACLTLVEISAGQECAFDVVTETLRRTNLGKLRAGDEVNVERSLRVGDRIDGHFVQGHVDAIATVHRVDRSGGEWKTWFSVDSACAPYIVKKGSITLDGTSMTVVDVRAGEFSVVLIPTTIERSMLGRRAVGDLVNVETDILARTIVAYLRGGEQLQAEYFQDRELDMEVRT